MRCEVLKELEKVEAKAMAAWQKALPAGYDEPNWPLAAVDDATQACEEHIADCEVCAASGKKADMPWKPSLAQLRCREAA